MVVSIAERNRRKRQRKKHHPVELQYTKEEEEKRKKGLTKLDKDEEERVDIVYTTKPLVVAEEFGCSNDAGTRKVPSGENDEDTIASILRRFENRASVLVKDDESLKCAKKRDRKYSGCDRGRNKDDVAYGGKRDETFDNESDAENINENTLSISKRNKREMDRPTVAELKNRVQRADLVEAHDVTAQDPDFLLFLKGVPGTVPVPRHWGRKRKYLQGKRGIEKAPFVLPDYIVKTGITDVRSAIMEDESRMSVKQKNRNRVAPKMGSLDLDYRVLHDAFFKYQNRESVRAKVTKLGDLYYEGKEYETRKSASHAVGGPLSDTLRDALGMASSNSSPPPWLINMQRYGPPPSYPNLRIQGLNAPLPEGCSYGYHLNGWGKPPVDVFGRPLYGGNPFDLAVSGESLNENKIDWEVDRKTGAIVTSDGKTIGRKPWGGLATGDVDDLELENENDIEEESEEGSLGMETEERIKSDGEISQVDEDEGGGISTNDTSKEVEDKNDIIYSTDDGVESVIPASVMDLRKQQGDQTPAPPSSSHGPYVQKQLYTVVKETWVDKDNQTSKIFSSDIAYVVPPSGIDTGVPFSGKEASGVPNGAESVLSKAPREGDTFSTLKHTRKHGDDDEEEVADLGKKFKF